MNRYLVLSFDDGPTEDIKLVELLNKYDIPATFNLNSGLEDFVWHYENKIPITRIKFNENLHLYDKHEIASHTITHPYLTDLPDDILIKEVENDRLTLSNIFKKNVTSFAVPFTACTEREIDIIKNHTNIKAIRLSEYKDKYDFSIPNDDYHYKFNAFHDEADLYEHIKIFSENSLDKSIFIIVGHSYEFKVKNDLTEIENLIKYIKSFDSIEVLTFKDAIKKIRE